MAVSVCADLSVRVTADVNADKLADRQQALRESVRKGEAKALGVSQVMMGLMVMSYSIPLLSAESTKVMTFGVPWWSGLSFITAGAVAIVMEKHSSIKLLGVCLLLSAAAILFSVVALGFYVEDLSRPPQDGCMEPVAVTTPYLHIGPLDYCNDKRHEERLSRGVKSCLLLLTLMQTSLGSVLSFVLLRERRKLGGYTSLNQNVPETPASDPPADL